MSNKSINLINTKYKEAKIICLFNDSLKAIEFETLADADVDFIRIDIFCTDSLEEARSLIKKKTIDLAIIPQVLGKNDFVTLQVEFKNNNSNINFIPVLDSPISIEMMRESHNIGGITDYGTGVIYTNYSELKKIIFQYLRNNWAQSKSTLKMFENVSLVQKSFLCNDSSFIEVKKNSKKIINELLINFDFSDKEILSIIAAESIYFPKLTSEDYNFILSDENFSTRNFLIESGSWVNEKRTPTTSAGFLITISNYLGFAMTGRPLPVSITSILKDKPYFLRHQSIKAISSEYISNFNLFESTGS